MFLYSQTRVVLALPLSHTTHKAVTFSYMKLLYKKGGSCGRHWNDFTYVWDFSLRRYISGHTIATLPLILSLIRKSPAYHATCPTCEIDNDKISLWRFVEMSSIEKYETAIDWFQYLALCHSRQCMAYAWIQCGFGQVNIVLEDPLHTYI